MQRIKQQNNAQELMIHKRRLSDIQHRKSSIPKLDKTIDIYKQNRYITARKQEINRWEGIMKQNQKLLKKLNNVESSFQKSVNNKQNILVFKIINSQCQKSIEFKENLQKENARMYQKLQKITSTFDKPNKQYSRISKSNQKLDKWKQPNSQEKSFNVQPIMNYRYQGKSFTKHKSIHHSGDEKQQIMSIIQKYHKVLDQLLPIIKPNKFNK
ncbi:unnamed protein product [Paramecium pentaurelia]|uniref:Uncharacterized protein n=1 Tax=Paramecium pentaurelia TaxID=43138 RepID=A0A8S1WN97_9CILI|nr:unnamed protein product [Paramecium pentaurelia]